MPAECRLVRVVALSVGSDRNRWPKITLSAAHRMVCALAYCHPTETGQQTS